MVYFGRLTRIADLHLLSNWLVLSLTPEESGMATLEDYITTILLFDDTNKEAVEDIENWTFKICSIGGGIVGLFLGFKVGGVGGSIVIAPIGAIIGVALGFIGLFAIRLLFVSLLAGVVVQTIGSLWGVGN